MEEGRDSLETLFLDGWWFFTPDWPSPKHDFSHDFERLHLRRVDLKDWESEPDVDTQGRIFVIHKK